MQVTRLAVEKLLKKKGNFTCLLQQNLHSPYLLASGVLKLLLLNFCVSGGIRYKQLIRLAVQSPSSRVDTVNYCEFLVQLVLSAPEQIVQLSTVRVICKDNVLIAL